MFTLMGFVLSAFGLYGLYFIICKIYITYTRGKCTSQRDLSGKVVIITGANAGIGLGSAREIVRRNAKVILACRSVERGKAAAQDIMKSVKNAKVTVRRLDLSSFQSVRCFVREIMETEDRLDVLINDAGMIGSSTRHLTEDGMELQFATNHLGPFLLTNLLLPLLKKSAPSRIVMVSSLAHHYGKIDFTNLNAEVTYKQFSIYCDTKLANVLFTAELNRRLEGCGVTVNALNPSMVRTNILKDLVWWRKATLILLSPFTIPFARTEEEGAQTSVYLAVSEKVNGLSGLYFDDCKVSEPSKAARDKKLAKDLWEESERLTGIKN